MAKPNYAFEKRQKELAKKKKKEEKEAAKAQRKASGGVGPDDAADMADAPEGAAGAPATGREEPASGAA